MVLLFASCGKGGDKKNAKRDSGPATPVAAPISLPAIGVDKITRFNFSYERKLTDAAKKKEWAEVRKYAEGIVAKDPMHFDAQRLLAIALAQAGEHAAAVDHLVAAIAGDYYKYGVELGAEPDLKDFLATQHGQAVTQLTGQIRDEYAKRVKTALLLVGRRSVFRWPEKPGLQSGYSRGELYAFDRESKRFFRLTHTDHQVAGFVRAKSGNELAVLGYDKIDRKGEDTPPLIGRAWVQAFEPVEWKNTTPRITLASARAVALYYGDGDQLLAATAPATARWTIGGWTASSVDRTTGKLTKVTSAVGAPRIELTLDEGRVVPPAVFDGVQAVWTGDPPRTPELAVNSTKIPVPESGQAAHETVSIAPGAAQIAFATAVDPCAKDAAPSLYVANGKTGALKHLLTAKSRFATRWLDATTVAYEDGDGAIRLWDATTGREAMRIENKPGIALEVLSLASAPLCKQAPPTAEPAGSGEEPMPPEEGSGGPITSPQQ